MSAADERLRALVEETGDVRDAVRELTSRDLASLAEDMRLSRSTLNHTLAGYSDRPNPAARRHIEVYLDLSAYLLDELIPERDE